MNIITAIENKKINEELNKIENINILNSDIQYKEGILEYLEKNKNIEIILIKENLQGQIEINELINNIQKINNKIKIIVLINNNKNYNKIEKEDILKNKTKGKNIKYIFINKINTENISKLLYIKNNNLNKNEKQKNIIIRILGNAGSGKTIFTYILTYILSEIKCKKVLLIDKDENKTLTKILIKKYINNKKNKLINEEIIKINNNIYLLNNKYLINKKINIINYLENIKLKKEENKFDYIIIDSNNKYKNIKEDEEIINKNILLLEPNILEIEKAKKYLNKNKLNIIFNKININSIDDEILKNIINNKIIGKIKYNKIFNLIINNNFNFKYLSKNEIKNIIKIIEKL